MAKQQPEEDMIGKLLDLEPEEEDTDEESESEDTDSGGDEEDQKKDDEDSEEGSEEEESSDEENEDGEGEEADASDDDGDGDGEADEDDEEGEEEDEQKRGLLRELSKLRRDNARLKAQQRPVAPAPSQTTADQQKQPLRVPVVIPDNGSEQVYVDPVALEALIRERIPEVVRDISAPTEDQIRRHNLQRAAESFVSVSPKDNLPAVEVAHRVDEYLTLQISSMMQEGYQFESVADAVQALRDAGVDKKIAKMAPEVAAVGLDEFIEGMASSDPVARKLLYKEIKRQRNRLKVTKKNDSPPSAQRLKNTPRAMASKGGSRVNEKSKTSDMAEFEALEAEYDKDVIHFPEKKFKRMNALGKKLGIDGYESA